MLVISVAWGVEAVNMCWLLLLPRDHGRNASSERGS